MILNNLHGKQSQVARSTSISNLWTYYRSLIDTFVPKKNLSQKNQIISQNYSLLSSKKLQKSR